MERLGLGRLGVGLHYQGVGAYACEGGPLVPIVGVGDGGPPEDVARPDGSGISIPASFALCQSVQAARGAGSACAMAQ